MECTPVVFLNHAYFPFSFVSMLDIYIVSVCVLETEKVNDCECFSVSI